MINKQAKEYADEYGTDENWLHVYEAYQDGYDSGRAEPAHPILNIIIFMVIGAFVALIVLALAASIAPHV
jgi:hypothetical protein